MSVRQSLLAILDQGPCYGYQLRAEFERRTGSTWPLNVGQIYNTLERLERDGLVAKGETDEQGHVYWAITEDVSAEVRAWWSSPIARTTGTRDELAIKIAVAATLPGVDADDVIREQHRASLAHVRLLDGLRRPSVTAGDGHGERAEAEAFARSLVLDAMVFAAEAEVRWLELAAERLSERPSQRRALELTTDAPKRGRPAKVL